MTYCLNPNCPKPQNLDKNLFCTTCGSRLLFQERYQPLKPLGEGSFERTFLAINQADPSHPHCILKEFCAESWGKKYAEIAAAKFSKEVERRLQLGQHPQIPDVYDCIEQDNRQYLVMQWIEGKSLAEELLAQGKPFKESQILKILQEVLTVLQYLHEHQVIHREVKPANLIRTADGKLMLVDFGGAKHAYAAALVQTGTMIGSVGYTAPEEMVGKAVSASDIYSLGVTCIQLLTQVQPFALYSTNIGDWVWRDYLVKNPVSDRTGRILDKMLQLATNRRYQSAKEVLEDLQRKGELPAEESHQPIPVKTASASSVILPKAEPLRTLTGHSDTVSAVAVVPDSSMLISGSQDGVIKLWNLQTGEQMKTLRGALGNHYGVNTITVHPDGHTLASCGRYFTVNLIDLKTGERINTLEYSYDPSALAFSPDGQFLAVAIDHDRVIQLLNTKTMKVVRSLSVNDAYIYAIAFSPDSQKLAAGDGQNIKIWDVSTGENYLEIASYSAYSRSLAFTSDGETIISSSYNDKVEMCKLKNDKLRFWRILQGTSTGNTIVNLSPNSQLLASATEEASQIKLWDLTTGELLTELSGHTDGIKALTFSPDSRFLISGSKDKTLKIWHFS